MFLKIVCAIFLTWSFVRVEGQCVDLLVLYNQCRNPATLLDDTFYKIELNGISTFNAAMEMFKRIYYELDWDTCSNGLCICVAADSEFGLRNYGAFFVNPNHYSDMLIILTAVRNKYSRSAGTFQNPMLAMLNFTVNETISQFCNNFDYSIFDLYKYDQIIDYLMQIEMSSLNTCVKYVSNKTNVNDIIGDNSTYVNYIKCAINLIPTCDREIKRVLIFHMISYSPGLTKNGLLTYIDSLISSAQAEEKNSTVVWVTGHSHIYSVMKGMETCIFERSVVCLQSENVRVNCTGEKVSISNGKSFNLLSEVKIKFTKPGQTIYFIADQTSFPATFSNGRAKVQDANGQDWLKLTSFSTKNFIVITDLNSNMIISIGKFSRNYFMVIQAPKMAYKPGGILFDGCPPQFQGVRQTASRKKRASSNAASVCSSSIQQSGNSLISSSDLYAGCVNDVVVTVDESYATMYKSTLDAYSEVKTAYNAAFYFLRFLI